MRKARASGYLPGILLLLSTVITGCFGLEVSAIEGPSVVMNGSQSQLVLDCKYDFTDEYEKNGLVVKWYFKRKPFPVYQWIPPNKPQVLGILKGRLNLDYEVSADEFSKHRALAIVNPTTELSGEYTCWISTFDSEHVERKMLTIYAPPSEMTLTYYKPRMDTVAVTCRAGGVYPAPDIVIFRSSPSVRKNVIEGAKMERRVVPGRGFYNISIELEAFDYDLDAENMFECVLTIPRHRIQNAEGDPLLPRASYYYYHHHHHNNNNNNSSSSHHYHHHHPLCSF
ncbi:hypothetical protein O3P69_014518 [Scylla paramamosain]|uniref:Ig-like domain-containing protein n=1 Tax=Scylla paramamosain TaxID=85552 RepID=A0AAW0TCF2_SCYPA